MLRDVRVAALSTELALLCSARGSITWADERAKQVLGERIVGCNIADLAVPGTREKLERLVGQAARAPLEATESSIVVDGRAVTFCFTGEPLADSSESPGGVLLVARRVSARETSTFEKFEAAMGELADLHRDAERSRRDIARKHGELEVANRALLDSNRALTTMHGVLDDKNDALRHASEVKSRVVANVSHEFRTPINSILGITQLLLDRLDGELTPEQEKQLRFVRSSAEVLSDLVNDLLDLSRIEAGRYSLRAERFDVALVLSSLRGMMRPLANNEAVALVVEDGVALELNTDRGKLAQILRNLVSNALKFTEQGEVRVTARMPAGREGRAVFTVSDTGIGIAAEDLERIFEEFTQIDSATQRKVRGTGLGLALSRRLAEMLGGTLTVKSKPGEGSSFILDIPATHEEVETVEKLEKQSEHIDPLRTPVLVVEDNRKTLFLYEKYLASAGFQVVPARSIEEARRALERFRPAAIVLDVILEGESTWGFLTDLKEAPETRDVPVMVVTVVDRSQKARALGADEFWLKPIDGARLARKLGELAKRGPVQRILVIDDDEASRYLMRRLLSGGPYTVYEAEDGSTGVALARRHLPHVIFLDFVLGEHATAFDVIDDLKADPTTRGIPVIIQTAKNLDESERKRLERETAAILSKESLSRELAISRIRAALEASGSKTQVPR